MTSEEADVRKEQPGGEPDPAVVQAAQELLRHAELANVAPTELSARLSEESSGGQPTRAQLTTEFSYSASKGFLANRFQYQIDLLDDEERLFAQLDFTLQVDYSVDPDYEPPQDAAEFVTVTTGLFAAYPYARELAQNLTTRLQLDPLVLGFLPRGATAPANMTHVRRSDD